MKKSDIIKCIHLSRIRHIPPVDTFDYETYKDFVIEAVTANNHPYILRFFKQGKFYQKVLNEIDLLTLAIQANATSRIIEELLTDVTLPLSQKKSEEFISAANRLLEKAAKEGWSRATAPSFDKILAFFNNNMLITILRKAYQKSDLKGVKALIKVIEKRDRIEITDNFADITTSRDQIKCLQEILHCDKFILIKHVRALLEIIKKMKSKPMEDLILKNFFARYHPDLGVHDLFISRLID
jgi:hypothetical protein